MLTSRAWRRKPLPGFKKRRKLMLSLRRLNRNSMNYLVNKLARAKVKYEWRMIKWWRIVRPVLIYPKGQGREEGIEQIRSRQKIYFKDYRQSTLRAKSSKKEPFKLQEMEKHHLSLPSRLTLKLRVKVFRSSLKSHLWRPKAHRRMKICLRYSLKLRTRYLLLFMLILVTLENLQMSRRIFRTPWWKLKFSTSKKC